MSKMTQMYAIEGWDSAIIGTCFRGGREVLVYDAYKIEELLMAHEGSDEEYEEFIELLERDDLGEETPVFIYADSSLRDEVIAAKRGVSKLLH